MNHNLLLEYLTELGTGDWGKFRHVTELLASADEELYPWQMARRYSMLGHVEFAFGGDLRWAVCPPVLAWLPTREGLVAAMCGGRNQRLSKIVHEKATELGLQVTSHSQKEGPEAIFVSAPAKEAASALAETVGLPNEWYTAERITRCLPYLDEYETLCAEAPEPSGYTTWSFDTVRLDWVEVPQAGNEGLYRYDYYRFEFRVKSAGRCLRTTQEIGIYLLLRRRQRFVMEYDPDKRELRVPVRAPLPGLFARAATLCSGLLPAFAHSKGVPVHVYHDIPPNIANAILLRLRQTAEGPS
jgi:hypothetical protein